VFGTSNSSSSWRSLKCCWAWPRHWWKRRGHATTQRVWCKSCRCVLQQTWSALISRTSAYRLFVYAMMTDCKMHAYETCMNSHTHTSTLKHTHTHLRAPERADTHEFGQAHRNMCIHAHVRTHKHTDTHVHVHTSMHTYAHICTHAHTLTQTNTRTYTAICMYKHTCVRTHKQNTNAHMCTCTPAHPRMHTHARMHKQKQK